MKLIIEHDDARLNFDLGDHATARPLVQLLAALGRTVNGHMSLTEIMWRLANGERPTPLQGLAFNLNAEFGLEAMAAERGERTLEAQAIAMIQPQQPVRDDHVLIREAVSDARRARGGDIQVSESWDYVLQTVNGVAKRDLHDPPVITKRERLIDLTPPAVGDRHQDQNGQH